jgi:Na+-transporting methylmalonyl-CoA/oxaloacetate decarboxylase gamma subunit
MSIPDSILTGVFTLSMVFVLLAVLYATVRLFSVVFAGFGKPDQPAAQTAAASAEAPASDNGSLRLINVDEPTAAMIMAIVSDESGIPLDELNFKSIKAL